MGPLPLSISATKVLSLARASDNDNCFMIFGRPPVPAQRKGLYFCCPSHNVDIDENKMAEHDSH
jgi:hypothetical protein